MPFTINGNFLETDTYKHGHVSPELMANRTHCGTCGKCRQHQEGSTSEVHSLPLCIPL